MGIPWRLLVSHIGAVVLLLLAVDTQLHSVGTGISVILVIGVSGIGIALTALVWKWWVRPLETLTRQLTQIAAGDLEGGREIRSSVQEVKKLELAVQDLRQRMAHRLGQISVEESRLEVILHSITEGILVIGTDQRIVLANRAIGDLFGVEPPFQGRRSEEVIRNHEVQTAVDQALTGHSEVSIEVSFTGGGEQHVDMHVAPIQQQDQCLGVVVVFYDITPLRRLERVRRDFVANVSHELRTPLTAIKGYSETLVDGALADGPSASRFVRIIAAHADRLTRVLDDLLELSKLESEQLQVDREACSIRRLAEGCVSGVMQQARQKKIRVSVDLPNDLHVLCAPQLVERALANLLENAVKYTPENGSVEVRHRLTDNAEGDARVVVEVADSGIGIPSDDLDRVFERFYRVDKGRSRDLGGTGLGLSIVRHVVESHGENVFLNSELGKGSTFGFSLPLAVSLDVSGLVG